MKTNDLVKLLILILITLVSTITHAQCVFTSTGVTSDWSLATTWSPSGCGAATVPNVANQHSVVINHFVTATGAITVIGDGGAGITVNSGGTLAMGAHNLTAGNWGSPAPILHVNDGGAITSNANVTISASTNVNLAGTITGAYMMIEGEIANLPVLMSGNITLTENFTSQGARTVNNTANIKAKNITILSDAIFNSTDAVLESTQNFVITAGASTNITGGEIIVGNDFTYSGYTNINIDAQMTVTNNMIVAASAVLQLGQRVDVGGYLDNSGDVAVQLYRASSILTVAGQITQSGSARIIGQGHFSFGSFSGSGGSYVRCSGGAETTWTASTPAYNPIDLSVCGLSILLPVEFLEFKAVYINNSVSLKWSTLSEKNNAYFNIQRSEDGISFYDINQVDGAGNSNALLEYSYTDFDVPYSGSVYYRIAQNDFDGNIMYSEIKNVVVGNNYAGQLYPNPVIEDFFYVETGNMTDMIVTVSDLSGQSVPVSFDMHNAQTIIVRFFDKPATGLYIINTISGEDVITHRLFVN